MIRNLSINNLLLIENIEMDIGLGLCVLTGETGAGKSMILESLELLSGRRVKSNIRPEKDKKTVIAASVDISKYKKLKDHLENLDIEIEDEIIIKRIINSDGKSKSIVNDSLVSLTTLKEIANNTIEVHSQFSEQGLLDNSTHIRTLDDFGDYQHELKKLSGIWDQYDKIKKEYQEEKSNYEKIQNQKDEYNYDLKELKSLNPIKNEFLGLEKKKKILKNSRKISENINQVIENFTREDPPGIENLLSRNLSILNQIRDLLDNETTKSLDKLESIFLDISEISKIFESFSNIEVDNNSLENIDDRVSLYKRLSKKHSTEVENLSLILSELERKIESTEDIRKNIESLKVELEKVKDQYTNQSEIITELRVKYADILDKKINSEFPDLKLENAQFKTLIHDCEQSFIGKDKVIFNIQTNPKSNMGEIKSISSGGELCRIALAIKVTAEKDSSSTMVFDEVDSGIGGAVSTAVGERLRKLGQKRQVLVVTHSPQVAALGSDHFLVKKITDHHGTKIKVEKLEGEEKTNEIARMLSGKQITNEAVNAAKKLIENSN